MTMVSYAQNHEDVLIARLFPPGVPGFYIDVGANDPVISSITKHFYDRGWHGINVEPSRLAFRRLTAERTRDTNLNVGLADEPGTLTFFEFEPPWSGSSTLSRDQATLTQEKGHPYIERAVEVTTLADLCARHDVTDVDFLSIDVEGHEAAVIKGGDWARWRPRLVVVEATEPNTGNPTHQGWEQTLLDAGYLFAAFDGLNRYYLRDEDRALLPALRSPVSVLDDYIPHDMMSCNRSLVAARALLHSVRSQFGTLPEEVRSLQAHYQRLERVAMSAREDLESLKRAAADAHATCEQALARSRAAQSAVATLEAIGPRTLRVAWALRRAADRFPSTASVARGAASAALRVRRRLR